jgi:hypothetical protein
LFDILPTLVLILPNVAAVVPRVTAVTSEIATGTSDFVAIFAGIAWLLRIRDGGDAEGEREQRGDKGAVFHGLPLRRLCRG